MRLRVGGEGEFNSAQVAALAALGGSSGGFQEGALIGFDTTNAPGGVFTFGGDLTDPGGNSIGLVKVGTGVLSLTGNNDHTGGTYLKEGVVSLGSSGALGANGPIVFEGGTLQFTAANTTDYSSRISGASTSIGIDTGGQDIVFATPIQYIVNSWTKTGEGTLSLNGLFLALETRIEQGTLRLTPVSGFVSMYNVAAGAKLEFNVAGGASTDYFGDFNGGGTLVKSGTGTLNGVRGGSFAMASGSMIDVQGGIFVTGLRQWTDNLSALHVAAGAAFNVTLGSARVDALTGSGRISTGSANLSFGVDNGSGIFDGVLASGAYFKEGTGTQVLSGENTFGSSLRVNEGTLQLDGSLAAGVIVAEAGVLSGHGVVHGTISGAGQVGPGNSPGILTADAVNGEDGLGFNFEFTLAGNALWHDPAASGNDVLHIMGGSPFLFALDSDNTIHLFFAAVGVTYVGGFFTEGEIDLLTGNIEGAGYRYYLRDDMNGTIFHNGNLYVEFFGGVTRSVVAVNDADFADGTVNGYAQKFEIVPESSTWGLLILAALALCFRSQLFPSPRRDRQ